MAITTLDTLIAGFKPPVSFLKASATSKAAAAWHSLWKVAGLPTAASTPAAYTAGSGYTTTESTAGALPFTDPASGNSYFSRLNATGATIGTLIVYDRLWHCSGFDTTVLTAQTITTPGTISAGRDSNGATLGAGVELWGEIYTATGASAATWTVSYTNSASASGRSATYATAATTVAGQMVPFTLQSGDVGVQAVASLTCSASSGTAGDLGLTLLRRVAELPISLVNAGFMADGLALGLPRLYDNSCLALMVHCSATNTGLISGSYAYAQG